MTTGWRHRVAIRHLFTKKEDLDSIRDSMCQIADALEASGLFKGFDTSPFRNIPQGDDIFSPLDYSDRLLNKMYDYADYNRIWIEL